MCNITVLFPLRPAPNEGEREEAMNKIKTRREEVARRALLQCGGSLEGRLSIVGICNVVH